ncbi:hypothetical protein VTN77DRAFT_6193 [Rasamsonia byssochlamydoides]|uniref:uncharacterized protein n=1 Tax=Rasamsonia byssochlamydoides TaxID=89139 RepID=UPI0037442603
MEQRQEAFRKLRPPCVELSSVALKFRARQNQPNDVLQALDAVYNVLSPLGAKDVLDEKLAEYVFFPLSQVFNETQALPLRCLEVAVKSLQVLVEKGWRQRLSPAMGKQLLILLTILAGGTPAQNRGEVAPKPQSEELTYAVFNCMAALFRVLEGPVAEETIYNEIGTATIIDQTVYILLEGVTDGSSDAIQRAAVTALQALFARITDRVVLASIMPRAVSALTKVLRPTTQSRRSFRLLQMSLQLLTEILRAVLNDTVALAGQAEPDRPKSKDRIVLDESWLKATTGQIKIALANVIQIRRHERREVKKALLDLCLMVIEQCPKSLNDSLVLMVETIVVLSELNEDNKPNDAYSALQHLATVYSQVVDILKDLLHTWTMSFHRTMQGNDEVAKQRAIRQISTAFQVLSQVHSSSEILDNNMASGLCSSVTVVVELSKTTPQPLNSTGGSEPETSVLQRRNMLHSFPPVLLEHRSQQQTLKDLQCMIARLNSTDSAAAITRSIMNRIHHASGDSLIAPFWLALGFLKSTSDKTTSIDEFVSFEDARSSSLSSSRATMIEELYSISLPILNEPPTAIQRDWRISALGLEAVALQAQQLGEAFRPELIDALYPVLQFLASNNPNLQNHAMACLNILTASCNYPDTRTMLIENVDYLVNSVALKLNTFDVSPYPPQVLLMMVKLCGAGLIPYLDDLVDSIFGIIDMYHGYPKLVELLFSTLGAIVEEGVKEPSLLVISSNGENDIVDHRKRQYQPVSVAKLVEDVANRRTKRTRYAELEELDADGERLSHPKRPWTMELDGPPQPKDDETGSLPESFGPEESDEPLPPPKEPEDSEKPLSKPHTLLLHIVKSIPPHLSSPSPFLRRSLLSLLTQALPVLARNENSFLPLINELWPSVNARITSPPSLSMDLAPSSLTTAGTSSEVSRRPERTVDEGNIKEETFVISAACTAVATMCEFAGDFMASRVESEYSRWKRLYLQAWEKVRVDAEKSLERRALHQRKLLSNQAQNSPASGQASAGLDLTLGLSLASSGTAAARPFTAHHTLWRGMLSLFISMLLHVRLPLVVGDEICEFLGAWIARFAGPGYYTSRVSKNKTKTREADNRLQKKGDRNAAASADDDHLEALETAIQAMETWNKDLTWFIFQQERARIINNISKRAGAVGASASAGATATAGAAATLQSRLKKISIPSKGRNGKVRFAEVVF